MPKVNMDYSNTIIYKIVCKDINITDCYVGQTTNFTKRKYQHKSHCNNINDRYYNFYVYQFIREHNGWENWDMIEIEKYKAIDKLDASKKERYWIEQLQATLNKQLPTRTIKEWIIANIDKIKEQSKERNSTYYTNNKDKHKECIKQYRIDNKDKHNEYMKNYMKQKRIQQKELKLMSAEDI